MSGADSVILVNPIFVPIAIIAAISTLVSLSFGGFVSGFNQGSPEVRKVNNFFIDGFSIVLLKFILSFPPF
jgi:hypothetical protein